MRRLEWFETAEDHDFGTHYRLVIESREEGEGFQVAYRLIDCGLGHESQFWNEFFLDERKGIFDAAYWAFWKVEELIDSGYPLENLKARLWTLARADVDSSGPGEREELGNEEWYSRSMENLKAVLLSVPEEEDIPDPPCSILEAGTQLDLFGWEV